MSDENFVICKIRVKNIFNQKTLTLLVLLNALTNHLLLKQEDGWNLKSAPKKTIMLTLDDGSLAKVSITVDDEDKTAKDLWDKLDKIYCMSNMQMVINIEQEQETFSFGMHEEWDKRVKTFHRLISKIAANDKPVSRVS